jgi:hypothetical protein
VNIDTNWILLAHMGDQLQALENKLMNISSSIKGSSPSSQKPVTKMYSECNPTYTFATHSFKIHFNIIIYTYVCHSLAKWFSNKIFVSDIIQVYVDTDMS